MLKAFSLLALLLPLNAFACKLNPGHEYISFSAPVTYLLRELKLLDDKSLKAISSYHPVDKVGINKLPGGIFLSSKTLSDKKNSVVFFDESMELKKNLNQAGIKKTIEVITRDADPFQANQKAINAISNFLIRCEGRLSQMSKNLTKIEANAKKINFGNRAFIFYLGKFSSNSRPPKLVIANDGIVKFFREKLDMRTYPSELAYVPPSSRILAKMNNAVKVGIYDSDQGFKVERIDERTFNIAYPQALSPGISQIFLIEALTQAKFFEGQK